MDPQLVQQLKTQLHTHGVPGFVALLQRVVDEMYTEAGYNDRSVDSNAMALRALRANLSADEKAGAPPVAPPPERMLTQACTAEELMGYFAARMGDLTPAVVDVHRWITRPTVNGNPRFMLRALLHPQTQARVDEKTCADYVQAVKLTIAQNYYSVHGFAVLEEKATKSDGKREVETTITYYLSPPAMVMWGSLPTDSHFRRHLRAGILQLLVENNACTCVPVTLEDGTYAGSLFDLISAGDNKAAYDVVTSDQACHGFAAASGGTQVKEIAGHAYHTAPRDQHASHQLTLLFQMYDQCFHCRTSTSAMRDELARFAERFHTSHFLNLRHFLKGKTSGAVLQAFIWRHDAFKWKAIRDAPTMRF